MKPLKRSTKPIKRSPLKRGPGKKAKAISGEINAAKDHYFQNYARPLGSSTAPCQRCARPMFRDACHGHHKIKRSLWATASVEERERIKDLHSKKNLVIIDEHCHAVIHDDPTELARVRKCTANAQDGGFIK